VEKWKCNKTAVWKETWSIIHKKKIKPAPFD